MVSSMDDSGHSGAGMSSAMSAIVQTSLREFLLFLELSLKEEGGNPAP
jgi:hypothetical protein